MIYEELKILTQNSDKKALSKALGYVREWTFFVHSSYYNFTCHKDILTKND